MEIEIPLDTLVNHPYYNMRMFPVVETLSSLTLALSLGCSCFVNGTNVLGSIHNKFVIKPYIKFKRKNESFIFCIPCGFDKQIGMSRTHFITIVELWAFRCEDSRHT